MNSLKQRGEYIGKGLRRKSKLKIVQIPSLANLPILEEDFEDTD